MRSPRLVFSLTAAAAVLIAVPAATAIGQGLRGPADERAVLAATSAGSAFTYQGRLTDSNNLPTAAYDLRFVLYDSQVGGTQVPSTPILTKDNVPVAAGLFVVTLDFGATVFDGQARWIELAVKPAASGQFTVLNPRQAVLPVPQALYARSAGALTFPLVSDGNSSTSALFQVTQLGAGGAITGSRAFEGATPHAAVRGENAGAGAGLQGSSSYASGIGVQGSASGLGGTGGSFSGKTGLKTSANDNLSTALEIDGAVKASGTNRFAFVHTSSAGNSFHNVTWITSPLTDGDPSAVIVVSQVVSASPPAVLTPNASPLPTPLPGNLDSVVTPLVTGLVFIPANGLAGAPNLPVGARNRWAIVRAANDPAPFPAGTSFNVIVIKQAGQ